jgi:hypothetical protein
LFIFKRRYGVIFYTVISHTALFWFLVVIASITIVTTRPFSLPFQ